MLAIRLQRTGRKNEPTFRVVLTDSKNGPKSGKSLEVLGSYDSRRGDKAEIKFDRVKYWMTNGAKLSGTVHNLLVSKKLIEGKKINVLPKKRPTAKKTKAGASAASAAASEKAEESAGGEKPLGPETPEAKTAAEAAPETPAPEAGAQAESTPAA